MDRSSIADEVSERIGSFQRLLRKHKIDSALMVQKIDLYYLSGTDQDAHLWVPASDEPILMVRKSMERALTDSALKKIFPLKSLSQIPECVQEHTVSDSRRVGLEMDVLPVKMYHAYQRLFPHSEMMDISPLIRQARMIKSPYEVSNIRAAAKIADRVYHRVPEFIKESETETDLAVRIEGFYRIQGHPGVTRFRTFNLEINYGHIISGAVGTQPSASPGPTGGSGVGPYYSQGAGSKKLAHNEPILIDYASMVNGYICDSARVFSIGKLHEKFYHAHQVMLEVQDAVAREGRPGTRAKDLYLHALETVEKAGLSQGFMGYPQPVPFVGHGIGLEMDEWPVIGRGSDTTLEAGMVIALEPKYVFPGEGVVGIENTFVVTGKGMEKLNAFPDDIVLI